MKRGLMLLMVVALSFSVFWGCASKCDPIYKDMHAWYNLPENEEAAKARLGMFVEKSCEGCKNEWVWTAPQKENIVCRDYSGSPQVARMVGKHISHLVIGKVNEIAKTHIKGDDGDFMRMKSAFMQECGLPKTATSKMVTDPAVCKDKKRDKEDKPYWYVRRIYKFEWRNSYKPSHEDMVQVEINKDKIAEALPGLKFDAGHEAQKNGVLTFSYDDGVWAAYRPNELHEWYCFKADYSKKE